LELRIGRWAGWSFLTLAATGMTACGLYDILFPSRGPAANRLLWHVPGSPAAGVPATDGTRVFFLTRSGSVIALDNKTGAQLWVAQLTPPGVPHVSSFAGCTIAGPMVECGDNGDLVGIRRDDGTIAWRFHPGFGGRPDWNSSSAVGTTIYSGSGVGGAFYAIDALAGAQQWLTVIPGLEGGGIVMVPVADSDIAVVPYIRAGKPQTGGVMVVDARTGVVRWNVAFPRIAPDSDTAGWSAVLWHDLVIASSKSGRIFAFERGTGAVRWHIDGVGFGPPSSPLPNRPYPSDNRALAIAGTHLYASSASGWFNAFDLSNQQQLARTDPKLADGNGERIVTDGKAVYVVYFTGAVVAFSAIDGSIKSMAGRSGGPLMASVALASDRFFVPGLDGYYAYAK
jgi:outer membrane protein assembly factor BamB